MIDRYFAFAKANGYFEKRRLEQSRYWMYESIDEALRSRFYNDPDIREMLADNERRVLDNRLSSFIAARNVLDFYFNKEKK